MGKLNIIDHKVVEDGKPLETATEKQKIEAICNAVALGDGLDEVFDEKAERRGEKAFMYYADFFVLIGENIEYSKMWDEANRKRQLITTEAVHAARKKYERTGSGADLANLKLSVEVAKISAKSLQSTIIIENNQIFPEEFFTKIYDKATHPDDIRKSKAYKERVKKVIGTDPMEGAFFSHVHGVESEEASEKLKKRLATERMAVRGDKSENST